MTLETLHGTGTGLAWWVYEYEYLPSGGGGAGPPRYTRRISCGYCPLGQASWGRRWTGMGLGFVRTSRDLDSDPMEGGSCRQGGVGHGCPPEAAAVVGTLMKRLSQGHGTASMGAGWHVDDAGP